MHTQEISAEIRTSTGKGVARQLRRDGMIPAVLYGATQEATALSVDPDAIEQLRRLPLKLNTPVELTVDGLAGSRLVMIKELQRHPVSRRLLHVDFLVVDPDKPVTVTVNVFTEGRSIGVQAGGVLNQMRRSITVRCLPSAIPEAVVIDITEFDVGHKVYINEIALPEGVEAVYDQRFPVLGVAAKGAKALAEEAAMFDGEAAEGEEGEGAEGEEGEAAEGGDAGGGDE